MFHDRHSRKLFWPIVSALMVVHSGLLAYQALHDSPTIDEVAHLPSGLNHLVTGNFSLYRVNPPLVRCVVALPVMLFAPAVDWHDAWRPPPGRPEFDLGKRFCAVNGERSVLLFAVARIAGIPFSLVGLLLVALWAREWFGEHAGMVSASLWCFSPNILGHGHLITPDVPSASFGIATAYAFARWTGQPCWTRAFLTGVLLSLALLCKTTWVLMFAAFPLQWLMVGFVNKWNPFRAQRRSCTIVSFVQLCTILLVGLIGLNHFYGWERSFTSLGEFDFVSQSLSGSESWNIDNRFRGTFGANVPVPLPANFVMGIDVQKREFEQGKESYLCGEIRYRGWWWYYLYALLIKTPVGTLLLVVLGTMAFTRRRKTIGESILPESAETCHAQEPPVRGLRSAPETAILLLITPLFLLVLVSSQTGFSQHARYVMPVLPFAYIWAGQTVSRYGIRLWKDMVWLAALAGTMISSLSAFPHHLSYFNCLIGGSTQGHYHLADSNVDWGQDLLYLKQWYDEHPHARPLYVASFGIFDPRIVGLDFDVPPSRSDLISAGRQLRPPPKGWYAISVHRLHGLIRVLMADGKGNWVRPGDYTYFLNHAPCDRIGYSMLIYRLDL